MKFAISSNKDFVNTTFDTIVGGLLQAGVPQENIYMFVGGHTEYKKVDRGPIHYYEVPYNSMDYNALIGILELGLQANYWFLLHDTCYIGPSFYTTLMANPPTSPAKALCSQGLSMNMGAYSQVYLEAIKPEILALKHQGDLTEFKRMLVSQEDRFLNPHKEFHYTTEFSISGPTDIYNNGVPRIVQCYRQLDLCKTKANWFPKDTYEVRL